MGHWGTVVTLNPAPASQSDTNRIESGKPQHFILELLYTYDHSEDYDCTNQKGELSGGQEPGDGAGEGGCSSFIAPLFYSPTIVSTYVG